jgi:fructose-1,6-bisphosphatase II
MDDLIASDNVFFAATGITTGDYLNGVTYFKDGARTDSVVMRGLSGTVRRVISSHKLSKLQRISAIKY